MSDQSQIIARTFRHRYKSGATSELHICALISKAEPRTFDLLGAVFKSRDELKGAKIAREYRRVILQSFSTFATEIGVAFSYPIQMAEGEESWHFRPGKPPQPATDLEGNFVR